MAQFHLLDIFQRERARCKVARIGIILIAFEQEVLEILIRNNTFASNYHMSCGFNLRRNALDGRC